MPMLGSNTALLLSFALVVAAGAALALALFRLREELHSWYARFPFSMPAMREPLAAFDLHEMCGEPTAHINGSKARAWSYRGPIGLSHLVLAGHANSAVCRNVTAAVVATYLSMDDNEDNLLVPGALLLRGSQEISQLSIELPAYSIFALAPALPSPLDSLPHKLAQFAEETGLVELNQVSGTSYWTLMGQLRSSIDTYRQQGQGVLLRWPANGLAPRALFAPFFILEDSTPLSVDVPLELFASTELEELKRVHKQSLILEMTADAERRKRLYEDWLNEHELMWKQYGYLYQKMTEVERNTPVESRGPVRIFAHGPGETHWARPGEVEPTTPKQIYERDLPELIEEDRVWIKRMDDLIASINKRDDKGERRLVQINFATLIDSFLRGWPPVFLSETESRECYKRWCAAKREGVWHAIHRQLAERQLRIDPLNEENTIFQARMLDDRTVRLTPFHVMTDQDVLIYLAPRYGLTYYVSVWPRRECEFLDDSNGHLEQTPVANFARARAHFKAATELLDRPSSSPEQEQAQVQQGVEELRCALAYQPLYAAQHLWSMWWTRYSRDTSAEFAVFRNLMIGITAYASHEYTTAATNLRRFVEHHPDLLPDPYVMLALQEQRKTLGIYDLVLRGRSLEQQYERLASAYNQKAERLHSFKDLIDRISGRVIYLSQLNSSDQQRYHKYEALAKELDQLAKSIEPIEAELKAMPKRLTELEQKLWPSLKAGGSADIDKARQIDASYVEQILAKGEFDFSPRYYQRYALFRHMFQADEYIAIAEALNKASGLLKQKKLTLDQLRAAVDRCLDVKYLEASNLSDLQAFKQQIAEKGKMDSIMREMVLGKQLDGQAQVALQRGLEIYKLASRRFPDFVEPFRQMIGAVALYRTQYRSAIEILLGARVALRNVAPQGRFEICDTAEFEPDAVRYDRSQSAVVADDPARGEVVLARAAGLSAEEQDHVERALLDDNFLDGLSVGTSLAELVLNCEIEPSPRSRRWSQAVEQLKEELIKVMGYAERLPLPGQPVPNKEVLQAFEGRPALIGVRTGPAVAQPEFLHEIGLDAGDVLMVEL
jgi:hypothetical protein